MKPSYTKLNLMCDTILSEQSMIPFSSTTSPGNGQVVFESNCNFRIVSYVLTRFVTFVTGVLLLNHVVVHVKLLEISETFYEI